MKAKNAQDRLAWLRQARGLDPSAAKIAYALGREFYQQARLDSAVAHFEQVILLDPTLAEQVGLRTLLPPAYNTLANRHLGSGDPAAGLAAAVAALRHNENFAPALAIALQASIQLNRHAEAVQFGERLVRVQPTARNHYHLGMAYEAGQEPAPAAQQYRQALNLDPGYEAARQKLEQLEKAAQPAETVPNPASPPLISKNKRDELRSKKTALRTGEQQPRPTPEFRRKNENKPETDGGERKQLIPEVVYETGTLRLAKPRLEIIPFLDSIQHRNRERELAERESEAGDLWLRLMILMLPAALLWYYLKRRPLSRQMILADLERTYTAVAAGAGRPLSRLRARLRRNLPSPAPAPALALSNPAATATLASGTPTDHAVDGEERAAPLPHTSGQHMEPTGNNIMDDDKTPEAAAGFGLQTEILFAEMIAASPGQIDVAETVPEKESVVALAPAPVMTTASANLSELAPAARPDAEHLEFLAASSWQEVEPASTARQNTAVSLLHELEGEPPLDIVEPDLLFERDKAVAATQTLHNGAACKPTDTATSTPASDSGAHGEHPPQQPAAPSKINRYVIEREISKGASGRIYKAWDPKLDRAVVLKIVHYGLGVSTQEIHVLKDRIYREARAIAKLHHPNIVVVYDIDDEPDFSYIVMEHLEGRDLGQILQNGQPLPCSRALDIVLQVCSALEYAHQAGVFHRDIKPSNIMLLANEEIKVMDFGIAKINDYLTLTQTGRVLGTPSYMAPEQIEGHDTDGRADLFSLGVVLYELLAGKRPFLADTLASLAYKIVHTPHPPLCRENSALPPELEEVLDRALAKKPAARFQSAAAFREALLRVRRTLA
ncbi:MAG: protein kinase [candidate division KSB1 bacterium]|nr:protein kinase [candidate division KSB1 bacterium]